MPLPLFAPTVLVGEQCPPDARVSIAAIDHGPFDALLAKYVDDKGRVGYAVWKANDEDVRALHDYLAAVGRADIDAPASHEAALAYWLNVYNALTLAGVLHVYPTTSVRNHTARLFGFNMWTCLRLHVGGRTLSLSEIEHGVLRALSDPRIHFALVCAASSCPILRPRAFSADGVNGELEASARAFLTRPDAVRIDPERQVVSLSRLFKWYGSDFAPGTDELLRVLRGFLPPDSELDRLDNAEVRVEYLPYDWKLNDRRAE